MRRQSVYKANLKLKSPFENVEEALKNVDKIYPPKYWEDQVMV